MTTATVKAIKDAKDGRNLKQHIARLVDEAFAEQLDRDGRFNQPIIAEVLVITPEMAGDWLLRNEVNRTLTVLAVNKYAGIITRGDWSLNGESIKFDWNGKLIDGQHRLNAIIQTDTPVQSLVIFGAAPESYTTLDQGRKRSVGDILKMQYEEPDHANYSSLLSWYWKFTTNRTNSPDYYPTTDQSLAIYKAHPGLGDSLRVTDTKHFKIIGSRVALALCHYILHDLDPEGAEEFFEKLGTGAGLPALSPILKLRERLINTRVSKTNMPTYEKIAIIIKAWNAWKVGRDMRSLSWRGGSGESFPIPVRD